MAKGSQPRLVTKQRSLIHVITSPSRQTSNFDAATSKAISTACARQTTASRGNRFSSAYIGRGANTAQKPSRTWENLRSLCVGGQLTSIKAANHRSESAASSVFGTVTRLRPAVLLLYSD
jgi:hypothetical protein